MSEPEPCAAAPSCNFSELWKDACTLSHLQSPRHRAAETRNFLAFNSGDSPGDVELSQDIFWDCTSPPPAGSGHRNGSEVEISDIVSRIAPKKSKRKESPLLQWIDDGALSHTPEVPKTRVRKKSARRGSVENLLKLARQFDENMQQNEALDGDGPHQVANSDWDLKKDPVEAELQALFDCSTQPVSGRLSEVSSQEAKEYPAWSADGSAVRQTRADDHWDNFRDDWENDDLLNDSVVLILTEDPTGPLGLQPSSTGGRRSCGALEEACPKPKATTRSTFRLEPNPHFHPKQVSGSGFTAVRPKLQPSTADRTCSLRTVQTKLSKEPDEQISDSSWGDEDDVLLCQACDFMEMMPNQHQQQDIGPQGPQGPQGALRHPLAHAAKVFVSSLKMGRCSAADIERKKQEALTRRRLRLQSLSKPS